MTIPRAPSAFGVRLFWRRRPMALAAVALVGVVGFFLFLRPSFAQAQDQPPDGLAAAKALEGALERAIDKASKSVVAIARVRKGGEPKVEGGALEPAPTSPDFVPNEFASGVVLDAKGLIVCNHHTLGDPSQNQYFIWIDRKPLVGKVLASDPWTDLAVLQVEATDLTPIALGDGAKARRGQIVVALGNPYATARDGQASAALGIVSNLSRHAPPVAKVEGGAPARDTLHHYGDLIQTDVKLQLGTSGGALIDLEGRMIGLTTSLAALTGFDAGAGFAIPVDDAFKAAIDKLRKGEAPEFGFLGVQPSALSIADRRQGKTGAIVQGMIRATPAAIAGLQPGDILTGVDDHPVADDLDLVRWVSSRPAGTTVSLQFVRRETTESGETVDRPMATKVALSKKPANGAQAPYAIERPQSWRGLVVEYLTAAPNFAELSRLADPEGCVVVASVVPDSSAARAGLKPGMLIARVGDRVVDTPAAFLAAVHDRREAVSLTIAGADGATERAIAP